MAADLANLFASAQPADLPATPAAIEAPAFVPQDAPRSTDRPAAVPTRNKKARSRPASVRTRPEDTPERVARTLFVGNVPVAAATAKAQRRAFEALFSSLEPPAQVESVRFRSLVSAGPMGGLGKRVAFITGEVHAQRDSCNAYVVLASAEDAGRVRTALNGTLFGDRHLRVDAARAPAGTIGSSSAPASTLDGAATNFANKAGPVSLDTAQGADTGSSDAKLPTKRSVFLGNLPLNVSDEAVWALFAQCGAIDYVRVIRDRSTGLGKGFGYVAFVERASVELAVRLAGADCGGRPVRVSKCAKPGYATAKKAFLAKKAATTSVDAQKQPLRVEGGAKNARAPISSEKSARSFSSARSAGAPFKNNSGALFKGASGAPFKNASGAPYKGASGAVSKGIFNAASKGASGAAAKGASGSAINGASGVAPKSAAGDAPKSARKTRIFKPRAPREKRTFGDVFGKAATKTRPPREKTEVHPALRRKQLHGIIRLPQLRASRAPES